MSDDLRALSWDVVRYQWEISYRFDARRRTCLSAEWVDDGRRDPFPEVLRVIIQSTEDAIDWDRTLRQSPHSIAPMRGFLRDMDELTVPCVTRICFQDGARTPFPLMGPFDEFELRSELDRYTHIRLWRSTGTEREEVFDKTLAELREEMRPGQRTPPQPKAPTFQPFKDNPVVWEDLTL